jgi:hypothetical protein
LFSILRSLPISIRVCPQASVYSADLPTFRASCIEQQLVQNSRLTTDSCFSRGFLSVNSLRLAASYTHKFSSKKLGSSSLPAAIKSSVF